jgi:hypothetical protein
MHIYEDWCAIEPESPYAKRVGRRELILASNNRTRGIRARRGDGTLGIPTPHTPVIEDKGYEVARGEVASIVVGIEVKIVAKAMLKQIDRVITDLNNQVIEWKRRGEFPLSMGLVGINEAEVYTAYEGDRLYRTGAGGHRHPSQEAHETAQRIRLHVFPNYDEALVLRFKATNEPPYAFSWVDGEETRREYGAALVRLNTKYNRMK